MIGNIASVELLKMRDLKMLWKGVALVIKIDFHVHTEGDTNLEKASRLQIESAIKNGIDGFCVTNHSGCGFEVLDRIKPRDFVVIPGQELSVVDIYDRPIHLIAVGIVEAIPEGLPILDGIEEIHKQGGLSIFAHPFRVINSINTMLGHYLDYIDGIEIHNAQTWEKWRNGLALQCFQEHPELIFTVGTDSHVQPKRWKPGIVSRRLNLKRGSNWKDVVSYFNRCERPYSKKE